MAVEKSSKPGLDEVRAATQERDAAQALLDQKTAEWKESIRRAAAEGVPKTELVKVSGVNRARVYQFLDSEE